MRLRKNVKITLYVIIAFVIGIIFFGNFNKIESFVRENFISKQEVFDGLEEYDTYSSATDDSLGTWHLSASVADNPNIESYRDNSQFFYTATSNAIDDNSISINYSFSYDGDYENGFGVEGIYFQIPILLFENERTVEDLRYEYSEADNSVYVYKNGLEVAVTSMGDIPYEYNSDASGDYYFRFDSYSAGDCILIYNVNPIELGEMVTVDLTVRYNFMPGMINNLLSIYDISLNPYDEITELSSYITLNLLFSLDREFSSDDDSLGYFEKSSETFTEWQEEWGVNVLGDGYYYNVYTITGMAVLNDDDEIILNYTYDDGTIVSYFDDVSYSDSSDEFLTITGGGNVVRSVVVAYPLPDEDSTSSVTFNANLSKGSLSKDFSWSLDYYRAPTEEPDPDPEPEYPEGYNIDITETLVSSHAGVGAVNRLKNGDDVSTTWLIESKANEINQTATGVVRAFNLFNRLNDDVTEYTINLETSGFELDATSSVSSLNYSLVNGDYEIKAFYPQNDVEYNYVLSDSSYILEKESDYSAYSNKDVYIYVNGDWELIGSYKTDGTSINYVSISSLTSNVDNVSESNPVVLPDNVTNIRVVYTGSRAAVYVGVNVVSNIKSSSNVVNKIDELLSDNENIVLRSNSQAYDDGELNSNSSSYIYFTRLNSKSNIVTSSEVGTRTASGDNISYTTSVYEQIDFDDSTRDLALSVFEEQSDAVLYDLLPIGVTLDSLNVLEYGSSEVANFTYTSIDNYNGSGRTLITITIIGDGSNVKTYSNYARSGYTVNLSVQYPLVSNQVYGTDLYNDFVYESEILNDGYDSVSSIPSNKFTSDISKNHLSNISISGKVLATSNVNQVESVTISVGTYSTNVKVENDSYTESISVNESKKYRYRLQYMPTSEYDQIQNLVFYDKLDSSSSNMSSFKGILDNVDTSYLNTSGVITTIYYSTNTDIDLDDDDYLDLTNTTIWNTYTPSDMSKVTAIAVSCGAHTFEASDAISPMIEISMIAPNSFVVGQNKKAYNSSYLRYNSIGSSTSTLKSNTTTVELQKAPITLSHYYGASETDSSTLTGTEDNPIMVSGNYGYKIEVMNSGDTDYNNLVVNEVLPDGININGDINYSENVTVNVSSNVVEMIISSLGNGEKEVIWIPAKINMSDVSGSNSIFKASVSLDSLENRDYNGNKLDVYTKAMVATLSFDKYAKTSDSGSYKKDEMVIITKGETYSYKINVKNTSSINASAITVVDTVADGLLNVSNISNGGIYDEENRTVTWEFDLTSNSEINLTYDVTVPSDVSLGTYYSASGHVSMVHPYKEGDYLYNENTNNITVLYQIVSDIKVTNKISGNLASDLKEFSYSFEFTAPDDAVGEYVVYKNGTNFGSFVIDEDGNGSYQTKLKANDVLIFKQLPGNVNYNIKLVKENGYEISSNISGSLSSDEYLISGVTNDAGTINYVLTNTYDVSTTARISAKITYGKEMNADMFKFKKTDSLGNEEIKYNDIDGNVMFDEITFRNESGLFKYTITQVDNSVLQTVYDTSTYFAVVNVLDDGEGNLSAEVSYYDQRDNEIDEIVFNNTYVPTGLTINCVNNSVYVDNSKEFNYEIKLSDSTPGEYSIQNESKNEIGKIVVSDDGTSTYNLVLKSNKFVQIVDLPLGTNFVITQDEVGYYESVVNVSSLRGEKVSYSGVIEDDNIQVAFYNTYNTRASYEPSFKVELTDSDIKDGDFIFKILDVSEGSTNGYTQMVSNDSGGNIKFSSINYDRPGVYKYEITQVKGSSKNVNYDSSKCLLTITLTDNGNGTMSTDYSIVYQNGADKFVNKYSSTPVVSPDDKDVTDNPNTIDNILIVMCSLLVVILFAIVNKIRLVRRY